MAIGANTFQALSNRRQIMAGAVWQSTAVEDNGSRKSHPSPSARRWRRAATRCGSRRAQSETAHRGGPMDRSDLRNVLRANRRRQPRRWLSTLDGEKSR
jgi:hypothetical protein